MIHFFSMAQETHLDKLKSYTEKWGRKIKRDKDIKGF